MTTFKNIVGIKIKHLSADPPAPTVGQIWYNTTSGNCTQEYDGSSWSVGGILNTARGFLAGAGIQNAALAFGGISATTLSCTEEYDGSSLDRIK